MGKLAETVETLSAEDQHRELQRVNTQLLRKLAAKESKTAELVAAVYDAARAAAIAVGPPPLVPVPVPDRRKNGAEVALVHTTDWQAYKVTETFGSDILAKRLSLFADKITSLTDVQRSDHPVNDCHVMLGGDMVEGTTIFPSQCVDEATEALTPEGWRRLDAIRDGFLPIATYDPVTGEMAFEVPRRLNVYDFDGTLLHYTTKAVDHMVTPNHDLWVGAGATSPFRRRQASTVRRARFYVEVAAKAWVGTWQARPVPRTPKCPGWEWACDPLDLAALVGWFVAEGSTRPGAVVISQSRTANPNKWAAIEMLLKRITVTLPGQASRHVSVTASDRGFTINSTPLSLWMKQFKPARAASACLPDWVRGWPAEHLQVLLDAMTDGDGTRHPNGTSVQVTTASRQLADDLIEIAVKLGLSSHKKDFPAGSWAIRGASGATLPKYVITLSRQRRTLLPPTEVAYKGTVWCPTVSTGLWVARRNGKPIITGNSWEVEESLFGQLFGTANMLETFLRRLLAVFRTVTIWDEYGNHGRLGRKGEHPAGDNVDRMVYQIVAERFKGEKRLTWHHTPSWHNMVTIGAYRAMLAHGDEIKSFGGNTPAFGILRKATAWSSGVVAPFHDLYLGHFHTPMRLTMPNGGAVYVTGSPESGSAYAAEFVAAKGAPSQRMHFVRPDKGRVTAEYTVYLDGD